MVVSFHLLPSCTSYYHLFKTPALIYFSLRHLLVCHLWIEDFWLESFSGVGRSAFVLFSINYCTGDPSWCVVVFHKNECVSLVSTVAFFIMFYLHFKPLFLLDYE